MRHPPPRAVRVPRPAKLAVLLLLGALAWACQTLPQLTAASTTPWYTVGGTVIGATGPLTVRCGTDSQVLLGAGAFTCQQTWASDSNYAVVVLSPPPSQTCTVSSGSGQVTNSDVTSVAIACGASLGNGATPTPTPTSSSTPSTAITPTPTPTSPMPPPGPTAPLMAHVTGSIPGASLLLSVNGQTVDVTGDGNTLLIQGAVGASYAVTVQSQGPAMSCQGSNLAGNLVAPATYITFVCQRAMNFSTNPTASVVLGQAGFTSSSTGSNQTSLRAPKGVASSADGQYMYIADTGNARLTGLALPTSSGSSYTFTVANQTDFDTPRGASASKTQTAVADAGQNMVYIYNAALTTDRAPDVTLGAQLGYCAPTSLNGPTAAFLLPNMLIVADTGNHRVLIYTTVPTSTNQAPIVFLGQNNGYVCQPRGASANSFASPQDVWTNGTVLAVADTGNNRVLLWSTFPTASNQNADAVLGQASGTASNAAPTPGSNTLNGPAGVVSDGTTIFVADTGNNRVLGFPLSGATANRAATLLLGQSSINSGAANAGASNPSSQSLSAPYGLAFVQTSLAVADAGNNRVVLFNSN